MEVVDSAEGHYPEESHPEVEECDMVGLKESHSPHFWIPAFTEDDHTAPEFVCSGWPLKIIDIFERQ